MEHGDPLPSLQVPANGPYRVPDEFNPVA